MVAGLSSSAPSSPGTAVRPGKYIRPTRIAMRATPTATAASFQGKRAGSSTAHSTPPEAERAEPLERNALRRRLGVRRPARREAGGRIGPDLHLRARGVAAEPAVTRRAVLAAQAVVQTVCRTGPSALGYSGWGIGPTGVGTKEGIAGTGAGRIGAGGSGKGCGTETAGSNCAARCGETSQPVGLTGRAGSGGSGGGGSFGPAEDERSLSFLARADFCC